MWSGGSFIYVPKGVSFHGKTHAGLLEVKGLGDVELETFSGRVYCRVDGHAAVKTYQGDIKALLKSATWAQPPLFASTLGTIEIQLPPAASVDVEALTRGEISTDFSLTIEDAGNGLKRALAHTGEGGQKVHLTNQSGAVKILQGRWHEGE